MWRRKRLPQADSDVDLTPMIDIIFFILAGRISSDIRSDWITVPPAKTAMAHEKPMGWGHLVIEVASLGTNGEQVLINCDGHEWRGNRDNLLPLYQSLRNELDWHYNRATRFADYHNPGLELPQIELEIRADANAEYRIVQEVLQIASDSVDPYNNMQGKTVSPHLAKPFVNILFTSFQPE